MATKRPLVIERIEPRTSDPAVLPATTTPTTPPRITQGVLDRLGTRDDSVIRQVSATIGSAAVPLPVISTPVHNATPIVAPRATQAPLPTPLVIPMPPPAVPGSVQIALPAPDVISVPPPAVPPAPKPAPAIEISMPISGGLPSGGLDTVPSSTASAFEATVTTPAAVAAAQRAGAAPLAGAAVGGAAGFFAAGPVGALVGVVLGFVAGRAGAK